MSLFGQLYAMTDTDRADVFPPGRERRVGGMGVTDEDFGFETIKRTTYYNGMVWTSSGLGWNGALWEVWVDGEVAVGATTGPALQ